MKTYCLPTLTYGIKNSAFRDNTGHKIQVIWNNCFRHIFSCCWRESVKPFQYFCNTQPLSYAIDQYCSGKKCLSVIIRLYAVFHG